MPVQGIASQGGSSSSLPQVLQDRGAQGIASQGGSSSSLPQVLQDRGAHEQLPLVVPPRDITSTTVASTSKLHIKDFATCLSALRRAAWPEAAAKSRSVISPHSEASGYNFGCQVSRRTALTRVTLALPELCVVLNGFLRLLFPQSSWNSICVAHNIVTAAHRDTANVEGSLNLSVSLGDFTGGQLWLADDKASTFRYIPALQQQIPGRILCTKETPTSFPAHAWHLTEPFVGDRWVLTAFTMPDCPYELLAPFGFPQPSPPAQAVASLPPPPCSAAPALSPSTFQGSSGLVVGVNWGRPSPFGFKHHSLAPTSSVPKPFPASTTASLPANFPERIFLDVCSGSAKPLSEAVALAGYATLSIDILLDSSLDLLQDSFFEQLLFICGSGTVGYCAASPSCAHYSTSQLSEAPPHAISTPARLEGAPGLGPSDLSKLQEVLARCCQCVSVVYAAGGHGHLEQPAGAMSWSEDCLQAWLHECSAYLVAVAACGYDMPSAETWLFACSFAPMKNLGCVCEHGPHAHPLMRGSAAEGFSPSRQTACYPVSFCSSFATVVQALLSKQGPALHLSAALALVPRKGLQQSPWAVHDGAGKHSCADWSAPQSPDVLKSLRTFLLQVTASLQGTTRILQRRLEPSKEPLFSAAEVATVREQFFSALGLEAPPDAWEVREHQPLFLNALEAVANKCGDPDVLLFPALKAGVSTGYLSDIPASNCFWPNTVASEDSVPLSIHLQNWRSATVDPSVTRRLLQEELDQGFCFKFEGSLAASCQWCGLQAGRQDYVWTIRCAGRMLTAGCQKSSTCPLYEMWFILFPPGNVRKCKERYP